MIKIEKLNPFGRMCISLGMLPSSYKESLTYEEQLLWFFKYLEETVIPTVNNNAEAVEELQTLYTEIKTYVDSYFDNLDVQEEINNKLDDMAESGQLTDIIAQYLQLAGVLAFNTINDLKNAENIAEGSICKTLGNISYNDGYGAFYKVRTITSSDVVDNINIVSLQASNTLIAERVINNEFNLNYYLGVFHRKYSESDKRIYLFLSNDGINFSEIPNSEIQGNSSSGGGDPSIFYDENSKTFLIAYSNQDDDECFTILKSKDLINWDEYPITLTLPQEIQGLNRWAPDFFRDKDGKIKLIFSADKTQNGFDFENLITELTDIENLTFSTPYKINISDNTSIYDCSIQYINNKYYMVASDFNVIKFYTSNDLVNFTLVNNNLLENYYLGTNNERALEGCNLSIINNKLMVYCEIPNIERYVVSEINLSTNKINSITSINSLQQLKHGSVINIDTPSSKYNVNNIAKNIINENAIKPLKRILTYITLTEDTTISDYTLFPNELIIINGNNHTLTINKIKDPYNLMKLDFTIYDGSGNLIINGYEDDLYSSYEYNATNGSGKKEKTIDFRFNALDNSYDYLTKDTGYLNATLTSGLSGNIYYRKIGNIVNVMVDIENESTYEYGKVLTTLPVGFRPAHTTYISVCNRYQEDQNIYLQFNTDGTIVYLSYTTSGNCIGNITYFV